MAPRTAKGAVAASRSSQRAKKAAAAKTAPAKKVLKVKVEAKSPAKKSPQKDDAPATPRKRGRPPKSSAKDAQKDTPPGGQRSLLDMWKKKVSSPKGKAGSPKKVKKEPSPEKEVEGGSQEEENSEKTPDKQPAVSEAKCSFCPRSFKTQAGVKIHESRCKGKPKNVAQNAEGGSGEVQSEGDPLSDPLGSHGDEEGTAVAVKAEYTEKTLSGLCLCCGEDEATAHLTGGFQCATCQKLFHEKDLLERHIRMMHDGPELACPQCGAKCPDKGTLARHMYTHTGLKPYSCPVCKQEFSRKYHLVRHNMQTGCDGKAKPVFPCQVCGREFNRKDNLREHLRAHAGQTKRKKLFPCDICGKVYNGNNLLQAHRKVHLGDKQHLCDFCPKKFTTSAAKKKHRRTHTGERPYECSTCHKRFGAKETLNRHVRIHTGYKPHSCDYCGKRFIQSSQLRSHLFYHTGQSVLTPAESFICELCGKKFNRRARLNEHTKFVHLGAKPFECVECQKTFIRKEDLTRHMIIHSGVRSHKCPICSKSFAMKSSLKVHLLTHTKEPPRSCDECGRAFIRQDCLLRHMRNKHRDMFEEIRSEAAKKKLQQQLLQVAAEASLVEGMEDRSELDDKGLTDAVRELLTLLVDEATLRGLGWPEAGVESILEAVIRRCGHEPAPVSTPHHDRLRHNIKLLFTVVIDDSAVKALLNNQTVDEVILHVLRLAKS
ncbi:Protein suppressor of hairy wing [Nesidiocoris tenuis]|uniref:Protein suppressor of hairy wing n=1 Tax=Nesidiocoris tenuis TaxID=355587 RepID=A0ABN7B8Z1_9HEMI|nr:Protein suppressor of hairy wing [Nesidiocoris tenuis]